MLGLCALLMFASCDSSGGSSSDSDETLEEEIGESAAIELYGSGSWVTKTIAFTLEEAATINIGVTGTLAWSSYCQLDNATLYSADNTTNLLSNGNFEDGTANGYYYDNWDITVGNSESGWGKYEVVTESSGNKYLNLSNYDDTNNSSKNDLPASATQTVELNAGSYTATIQVAGDNEGSTTSELTFSYEIVTAEEQDE